MVELLIVVAATADIGAVALTYLSNTNKTLQTSKLEEDVSRLNSAVSVFTGNGGRLDPKVIETAQDVLTELKKVASNQKSAVSVGGSMIDNRLLAVSDSDGELRDRAIWKGDLGKFVIERSKGGVREFILDETLADVDFGSAKRDTKLVCSPSNGWVWETADYGYAATTGPSNLPKRNVGTLGAGGSTGSAHSAKLGQPVISPGSGARSLNSYPLQVSISTQPSDPISATIFYSTETNVWIE